MSVTQRVDAFQRAHPSIGFPLAVIYKFIDDSGSYLAALITYYAFVSLFPLLLLATTILGFVLHGDSALQHKLINSALGDFPVVGAQLHDPKRLGGGVGGLIIGVLGAVYGGLGVAQAAQYAMNTAWHVPRNSRPNPLKGRGRSLLLLATVGTGVIATSVLSGFGVTSGGSLGVAVKVLLTAASVLLNAAVFVFAFRVATARSLGVRDVLAGAVIAAVAWQLLQTFGVTYVTHVVNSSSATNSVFALVLGLLAFLYLAAIAVVFCVEINVVHVERLHPRALLTPFTDNVTLTGGDQRSYAGQATAQRSKGFETVEVTFEPPGSQRQDDHPRHDGAGSPAEPRDDADRG